ncbi:hypothetical protein [Treponema berlinense]|uniref:hypothetical protein n=1 Tax=Treponema berlinense TaxID=225004 RepID=UPI0026ECB328|nr:hypothetical protein [Treponema berlinense]
MTVDYEKLVKITNKLWNEKGYNVCALWKMSKITNALSGFTLSLARAVAAAKPFRSECVSAGMKAPRRRNCGADGLTVDVLQKNNLAKT